MHPLAFVFSDSAAKPPRVLTARPPRTSRLVPRFDGRDLAPRFDFIFVDFLARSIVPLDADPAWRRLSYSALATRRTSRPFSVVPPTATHPVAPTANLALATQRCHGVKFEANALPCMDFASDGILRFAGFNLQTQQRPGWSRLV